MCIRDRDIARGFVVWLSDRSGKKPEDLTVAVGRDPRISGKRLVQGMMNGFGPYGVKVYDCGLASTPAMFMTTVFPEFACDAEMCIRDRDIFRCCLPRCFPFDRHRKQLRTVPCREAKL